jgi:hypothetical protein
MFLPDFYPSRIPDPTTAPKEDGNKFFCPTIFLATNTRKLYDFFLQVENFYSQNTKNNFTRRFVKNIGQGSGIWKKPIQDPGTKRHRIQDPQHCS